MIFLFIVFSVNKKFAFFQGAKLTVEEHEQMNLTTDERVSNALPALLRRSRTFLGSNHPGLLSYHSNSAKTSPPRDRNKNYVGQTSPEKIDPFEMYTDVDTLVPHLELKIAELELELGRMSMKFENDIQYFHSSI